MFMKRKYKILIILGIIIVVIIATVFGVYEFYAKNKIESALQKAQNVLVDEDIRKEVDTFVTELEETGVLDAAQVQEYTEQKESYEQKNTVEQQSAPAPKKKQETLVDKVKGAMTTDEFSFAMSMYGKVDAGYVLSNINTDRAAVKKYLKSVLTSDEISKSLAIYNKYSYLLK